MKIKDLQTGRVFEYGNDSHDGLMISEDGRFLSYNNLQNGDGSRWGDYRFVLDDGEVPQDSSSADALHGMSYVNVGGFARHGHWCEMDLCSGSTFQCSECGGEIKTYYKPKFCEFCGADMRGGEKNVS